MGGSEVLAGFLTFGWNFVSGESPAGGGAPGGIRQHCQNELARILNILGKTRESLDEEISRSCKGG